ncbi:hypothetical protein MUG84_03125 [Paenibacillus sp. KQZ6P-2]|uniref:Uncharacterized protein n=1 Tax=Paenibacillus mangrovi TaxID=2931978 RepID=A0A9X1WLJ7_9BACL|nr:hypothetical protein [Paenibacillus mangrovi]MCJ8010736.1 hypothetical protein [Paenibacillus mangrovi]
MNPIVESLLGIKAFNDQFIAEDLLQDNRLRMERLLDCLQVSSEEQIMIEIMHQIQSSIELEQRLLKLSLDKDWLTGDPLEQLGRDLKRAQKAPHMIPNRVGGSG